MSIMDSNGLRVRSAETKLETLANRSNTTSMVTEVNVDFRQSLATAEAKIEDLTEILEDMKTKREAHGTNDREPVKLAANIKEIEGKLPQHIVQMDTSTNNYSNHQTISNNPQMYNTNFNQLIPPQAPRPFLNTVHFPPNTYRFSNVPVTLNRPPTPTLAKQSQSQFPVTDIQKSLLNMAYQPTTSAASTYTNSNPYRPDTISPMNTTGIENNTNSSNGINSNNNNNSIDNNNNYINSNDVPIDNNTELLVLIDSNSKYVDQRKFWTPDGTNWKRCGTISEATNVLNEMRYTKLQYVLLSVGVNDIDDEDGRSVARRMSELVRLINQKYPNTKIIVNEVTPRTDARDDQVKDCNKSLHELSEENDKVFVAEQWNLRDPTFSFFSDSKHIKAGKIARYVNNVKIAMRRAYGMLDPRTSGKRGNQLYRSGNGGNQTRNNYPHHPQIQSSNERRGIQGDSFRNQRDTYPQHPQSYDARMRKDVEEAIKMEIRRIELN